MRRFLLVLTFISFAGWSQPAQPQAQAPIPVRIEMPPESVWMMLLKVILPTILGAGLGAGITLYGIRQNNKHNASENEANRKHQLEVEISKAEIAAKYRSQDNRWAFRKDVYVNLIKVAYDLQALLMELQLRIEHRASVSNESRQQTFLDTHGKIKELLSWGNLAPLAKADDVLPILAASFGHIFQPPSTDGDAAELLMQRLLGLDTVIAKLQAAGRKDLWDTPETEAERT